MNTIKDIRIYRSQAENIAGNSLPHEFANKELSIMLHRIAMKLIIISYKMWLRTGRCIAGSMAWIFSSGFLLCQGKQRDCICRCDSTG